MHSTLPQTCSIRRTRAHEYAEVGQMIVTAYANLPGMPQPAAQPEYYSMLADVERRNSNPAIRVFVATNALDHPVGSIDFIGDMQQYGAATRASELTEAAGIRLLAVRSDYRGQGIGKALTLYCVALAREYGKTAVVLHSTRVMQTAWAMYEHMGFERFPDIDFVQGSLEVFGFKLDLRHEWT